jgi:hypothetical protein
MSYFAGGVWWSNDGQAFKSQAEAEQHEKTGTGGATTDEFAAAMGRGGNTGVQAPTAASGAAGSASGPLSGGRASGFQGAPSAPQGTAAQQQAAFAGGNIGGAGGAGGAQQVLTDRAKTPSDPGLFRQFANTVGAAFDNPVVNPIGYAASKAGQAVDNALGVNVSGYIQDPVGQGLNDLGAPAAVQAIANPTGFATRTAVNADTGYGTRPGAVLNNVAQGYDNVINDARNTAAAAPGVVRAIGEAANSGRGAAPGGGGTNAPTYAPPPLPTPGMTPQQIMGMQTNAARPSSAQSDAIVQQMMGQANVQSGYQDFNNANYDASRGAAMGYTSQLAGLANNNVAVTGLESGRYDQSRGTVNQITGQLQAQANNNVSDIQADSAQRDASRAGVLNTADALRQTAFNDVARIDASQAQRMQAQSAIVDAEKRLSNTGMNTVGDIQADATRYDASSATSNDIIQRLLAAAEREEGPSAAQALMLNAQERAVRNAYGDAGSLSGGWRSQLTGQRRAMGQAATMQTDIAAQLGALRAQEENDFRNRELAALGQAGGLSGDMSGRDLSLAQSDAALLAQIRQGNQTNFRESNMAAGALASGRMQSDTALAVSDADRAMLAAQGNQDNRLAAQLGAGGLQSAAMVSDTGLAQSNASLLAQVRQGNQQNSLNSLLGAGNTASNVLNADLGFATNDAQIRTQRELANQQNALNAMLGATNAANQTAGLDANIGTANADRRAQVDQNNRANSIAALQNAGVLSSTLRGQDVQLAVADQQALSSRIASAAGLAGSTFSTQMDAAMRQQDLNLRQQQFEFMKTQAPQEWERWLAAAGSTAGLLGVLI